MYCAMACGNGVEVGATQLQGSAWQQLDTNSPDQRAKAFRRSGVLDDSAVSVSQSEKWARRLGHLTQFQVKFFASYYHHHCRLEPLEIARLVDFLIPRKTQLNTDPRQINKPSRQNGERPWRDRGPVSEAFS